MQSIGAAVLASALASTAPSIELDWPEGGCPSRADMEEGLRALGVGLGNGEQHGAVVQASRNGEALELQISAGERQIERTLHLEGTCAERAAVVAAVIDRAVRPLFVSTEEGGAAEAEPGAAAPSREFEIELAPQGKGAASRAPPTDPTGVNGVKVTLADGRPNLWILSGALVVLGGEGPTFRGGADAEVRYEFAEEIFAVMRLSYRTPLIEHVGPAEVRLDDGTASVGLQIGNPNDPLAIQANAMVQVTWSHGNGLDNEYSVVRANPGVIMGVCYQRDLGIPGLAGLEACARGFGYLIRQEIHVNGAPVLGLPRVGGELTLGFTYQIFSL